MTEFSKGKRRIRPQKNQIPLIVSLMKKKNLKMNLMTKIVTIHLIVALIKEKSTKVQDYLELLIIRILLLKLSKDALRSQAKRFR
jgi:hypothetical protein